MKKTAKQERFEENGRSASVTPDGVIAVPRAKRRENMVIRGIELEKSFPVVCGYIVPSLDRIVKRQFEN
jgi:hypothetical protein